MKRALIGVVTALSLALGAGVAQADGPGNWGNWGDGGGGQSSSPVVAVAGVVTGVTANGFTANAFVPAGDGQDQGDQSSQDTGDQNGSQDQADQSGQDSSQSGSQSGSDQGSGSPQGNFHRDWFGGGLPSLTPVTIPTDSSTTFRVDGQDATLADLAPGDRFVALFNGSPGDSLQTLVASPAVAVFAHTPPMQHQLYAFVGTVTGVDTTGGTVTVQVSNSLPSGFVPAGSNPATFTVSPSTMILGGSSTNGLFGGALSDVSMGDVVAGGLIGPAGETLSQVESSPLQVLVDFPAAATPSVKSASMRRTVRQRALSQALALFGYKARTTGKGHKARRGKSHHHGRNGTSRTRSNART